MKYFLIEYQRSAAKLLSLSEFTDYRKAAEARLRREIAQRNNRDVEIVILGAKRREDLDKTHGRYFDDTHQLSKAIDEVVADAAGLCA